MNYHSSYVASPPEHSCYAPGNSVKSNGLGRKGERHLPERRERKRKSPAGMPLYLSCLGHALGKEVSLLRREKKLSG